MKRFVGFFVGMMGLTLAVVSDGAFAATECNTGPPPAAPLSGTIASGVVVNAGDFCVLAGANVSGGVQVNSGGVLIVCASVINGGVVSDGAAGILLGPEEISCPGNVINGGVTISNTGPGVFPSPAPSISIENSVISGAVHLSGNKGPIVVAGNAIGGGLFCKSNATDLDNEGNPSVVTGRVTCQFE
jgi:hypothetical protein